MAAVSLLLVVAVLCSCCVQLLAQHQQLNEKRVLAEFKQGLNDSDHALKNWDELPNYCQWSGITCSSNTTGVTAIDFTNFNLSGTISPAICELPQLETLRFRLNNFTQAFPSQLQSCGHLKTLDLSENFFFGPLPSNLFQSQLSSSLQELKLNGNYFNGTIPKSCGNLSLSTLVLAGNHFTGPLPAELGSISNLTHLDITANPLFSSIPPELGRLTKLQYLALYDCELMGRIPAELGNMKELHYLGLQRNNLSGSIPSELMFLPKLKQLELYENQLSGELPHEIGNLASLEDLDASQNDLTGTIPDEISLVKNLRVLQLYHNRMSGELPPAMADLPLVNLSLYSNSFTGSVPPDFGRNSSLVHFNVASNKLSGSLPPYLCSGGSLKWLSLYRNTFSGIFPESYGSCRAMVRFQVQTNNISGTVPQGLWTAPNLTTLNVRSNSLTGTIPSTINHASQLQTLFLDENHFNGALPHEIGDLPNLVKFTAAGNEFTGSVPFGRCASLEAVNLSENSISGPIPAEVSNCLKLASLDLSANNLSGPVPATLGDLLNLNALNLSKNHLNGSIPPNLENLRLSSLDLSNNNFTGVVPKSWKASFPASSFAGNPGFCLQTCKILPAQKSRRKVTWIAVVVVTVCGIIAGLGLVYIYKRHRKLMSDSPNWKVKSFHKFTFNEMDVLEALDRRNVIGRGQSGEVYRVDLWNGQTVALKQLWKSHPTSQSEFRAEMETLGSIRHRNIVKLLSCCSSPESDFLILQFMPNGSLGDVLHRKRGGGSLNLTARLKIALGAAQGLSYLHHDCWPPILHRDIKSNNILLDVDYEPKLADFGLARMFENGNYYTMTDVAGSYGYIAPEYAYTLKVSMKCDIYSFGVVLLELATGRRPIQEEVDLVQWSRSRVHTKNGVFDSRLMKEDEEQATALLKLGLLCTSPASTARPSARQVVQILKTIQQVNHNDYKKVHSTNVISPGSTSESISEYV